jgi:Sec-independent protein translocase protein TatA
LREIKKQRQEIVEYCEVQSILLGLKKLRAKGDQELPLEESENEEEEKKEESKENKRQQVPQNDRIKKELSYIPESLEESKSSKLS